MRLCLLPEQVATSTDAFIRFMADRKRRACRLPFAESGLQIGLRNTLVVTLSGARRRHIRSLVRQLERP